MFFILLSEFFYVEKATKRTRAACTGWLTRTVSAHISWWPWAALPTRWVMDQVLGGLVWCRSCFPWLADKDSLRSHILVAMGSLAYKVKGLFCWEFGAWIN